MSQRGQIHVSPRRTRFVHMDRYFCAMVQQPGSSPTSSTMPNASISTRSRRTRVTRRGRRRRSWAERVRRVPVASGCVWSRAPPDGEPARTPLRRTRSIATQKAAGRSHAGGGGSARAGHVNDHVGMSLIPDHCRAAPCDEDGQQGQFVAVLVMEGGRLLRYGEVFDKRAQTTWRSSRWALRSSARASDPALRSSSSSMTGIR